MLQLSKEDGQAAPVAIRREDYTAPAYWIDSVELTFDLDPAKTRVLNRMTLRRNADVPRAAAAPGRRRPEPGPRAGQRPGHLVQDGRRPAGAGKPARRHRRLRARNLHHLRARQNTKLMGLYVSNDSFFTSARPRVSAASPTSWTARM